MRKIYIMLVAIVTVCGSTYAEVLPKTGLNPAAGESSLGSVAVTAGESSLGSVAVVAEESSLGSVAVTAEESSLGSVAVTAEESSLGSVAVVDSVLLKNSSFEVYKTGATMFGQKTEFEDWELSGIMSVMIAAETSDVLDGKAAFKTTSEVSAGYVRQEIDCKNYVTGDLFDARICYKNLDTKDSAIVLDCYWCASMGGDAMEQTAEMTQVLPNRSVWDSVRFRTAKPEGAKYFVMKIKFRKSAQVLLDNMDFVNFIDTLPYFAVLPEKDSYIFNGKIDTDTMVAKLTIRQRNLTQPIRLQITGKGKGAYSVSKSQVTAEEETVEVTFHPTDIGSYNATLNITDDESPVTSLMNTTVNFYGTAYDPTKKPEVSITPQTFSTFRCKAYESVTDTFYVVSKNCHDYVHVVVADETGDPWAFGISDSYFLPNHTDTVVITFAPKKAGSYTASLKAYTTGVDTIYFSVAGVAEEGKPEPKVVDWDTVFTWNSAPSYSILHEQFDHADTCYNKTLRTTDWQNVVRTGARPWWGYRSDSTKQAKITSYYSFESKGSMPMENWLVTPALDYKKAPKQVFSFKVMGEFMQEEQTAKLEVYYIDASDKSDVFFQHIEAIDSLIPAKNSELNGEWVEVYLSLEGQVFIPDVFYMAFKFTDLGGTNGIVYYIDDVTWGMTDIPQGEEKVQTFESTCSMVRKYMRNGQMYIIRDGKRYSILGMPL